MHQRMTILAWILFSVVGCGGNAPQPKNQADVSEPKVADDLPTWCSGDKKPCVPEREFASKLCRGQFRGAALFLFQKQSPWERRWVKSNQGHPAINGEGGPTGEALLPSEEVLVLAVTEPADTTANESSPKKSTKPKKPDPEILALRWDGTCASLKASALTTRAPQNPTHPIINFSKLDPFVQSSLTRDSKIASEAAARDKACTSDAASSDCEMSEEMLSNSVVKAVRRGTKLSMPEERP